MTNSNNKKIDMARFLKSMGLQEEDLKRETSDEVMIPKMTLIGILETIEHVCGSLKHTIITSPGKLNVGLLRLYFTAITSSSVFALKVLKMYERAAYDAPSSRAVPLTVRKKTDDDGDSLPEPPEEFTDTELLEMMEEEDTAAFEEDIPLSDEEIADLAAIEVLDSESEIEDEQSFDDILKNFHHPANPKGTPPDPKKQN